MPLDLMYYTDIRKLKSFIQFYWQWLPTDFAPLNLQNVPKIAIIKALLHWMKPNLPSFELQCYCPFSFLSFILSLICIYKLWNMVNITPSQALSYIEKSS